MNFYSVDSSPHRIQANYLINLAQTTNDDLELNKIIDLAKNIRASDNSDIFEKTEALKSKNYVMMNIAFVLAKLNKLMPSIKLISCMPDIDEASNAIKIIASKIKTEQLMQLANIIKTVFSKISEPIINSSIAYISHLALEKEDQVIALSAACMLPKGPMKSACLLKIATVFSNSTFMNID